MGQTARLYKIHQMLENRRFVTFQNFLDELEVSRATLKRDLVLMKDQLKAPIVFDRSLRGYRFDHETKQLGGKYELPGLWFSADEIRALLTMQHLLANLDTGGLLGPHIKPLLSRLKLLLVTAENPAEEIEKYIKIIPLAAREIQLDYFQLVGSALLRRKRLMIRYRSRGKNESTEREISPQRLVHYRENWYLDAWCHLRNELRSFSVDTIEHVELLEAMTKDVSENCLDEILGSGYGIFSGADINRATLRFSPFRARWVSTEKWHPKQIGKMLPDGSYELKMPYSNDTELMMDILRYGADCQVVGPKGLKKRVQQEVMAMSALLD